MKIPPFFSFVKVAIKLEPKKAKSLQLFAEAKMLRYLQVRFGLQNRIFFMTESDLFSPSTFSIFFSFICFPLNEQGGVGIPGVKWYGEEGDYNVMVMELLGDSLEMLLQKCGGTFSLKTVMQLADQVFSLVK